MFSNFEHFSNLTSRTICWLLRLTDDRQGSSLKKIPQITNVGFLCDRKHESLQVFQTKKEVSKIYALISKKKGNFKKYALVSTESNSKRKNDNSGETSTLG